MTIFVACLLCGHEANPSRQILRYGSSKVQYKTIHTGLDKKNNASSYSRECYTCLCIREGCPL